MKRARDVDDGENIPACIVVLKNQHGYFGWEGQRKRCHGAASGVISDLNSSTEILKGVVSSSGVVSEAVCVSGTQSTACSDNEFLEALVSNKPGNSMHDDRGKLGSDPKERRKKEMRTKQRPKVVEIEKTERKPKMGIPMPPQTPKQKFLISAAFTGTRLADCSSGELVEALVLDKSGNGMHDDRGKLGADSDKEWRIKKKRKKYRPKVVEIEKTERKCKMETPKAPQTPSQKSPGKKKGKVIGRKTFAKKKLFENYLEDDDEWEEASDHPKPASADEAINPSNRIQFDVDEYAAEKNVEPCGSGVITENLPAGSSNSSRDVNIGIDELLQELAKLPMKSSSPLLLKAELLQLNIECPVDTLSYIVDNIRIPYLLYFVKQARRNIDRSRIKSGYKLGEGLYHSKNKVLEDFISVLKKCLPSLLLKNDQSTASGYMFNNRQGGRSKRKISGSRETKAAAKKLSMSAIQSNFQIVPYTQLYELSSRFQHIEASCTTPVMSKFTANGQTTHNWGDINLTPNQGSSNAMELALQSVTDKFSLVDIDNNFGVDSPAELQNALVPFVGGGMIVSCNRSLEQVRQKPHRAEVLLDPETNRLWRFLQENEGDDNVEGMDSCDLKWWENERCVFLGRAKSFTARMNLILGDRRFSPWKGSIVDSVVGVFLTQNVSDHLSSSAFMSLAAKFPLHRRGEGGSSERKLAEEHEETSTDAMGFLDNIPSLSNCDAQDPMDIQLNGHLLEDLTSQSHWLQNSFVSSRMDSENAMVFDVDGCIPQHVAIISKAFRENAENECRYLPRVLSELVACSNVNNYHVYEMDAEKEATISSSSELEAHFRLEKNTSNAKKANYVDEGKIDWEVLRRKVDPEGGKKVRSRESLDSVDWEAVRNADVNKISEAIRERGMNNLLANRIKDFLNRLFRDHGSIDLEWLRNVCPDEAKKYLLSIRGLGLKSVECVRLLALQNVAFPVDTNVARISVRLGWVPLKPLPEFLQLHLLEQYPIMDSVQKYIWPRLCKLDQKELYELHYHMITFGKVFCTKSRPNCKVCPMRGECKHFNSAKLALPAPEDKQFKTSSFPGTPMSDRSSFNTIPQLPYRKDDVSGVFHDNFDPVIENPLSPIIEEPPSPPREALQILDKDIEDAFYEDDEIPTIKLNLEQFGQNLQNLMQENDLKIPDNDISKALVELSAEVASMPIRKLKNISGLRTEHHVYELPDSHLLLKEMHPREPDDPSPYLLAIWTPGETAESTESPESCYKTQEAGSCERETCFACNSRRELEAQTVRGTLLIPCRTAMRGRFPLNGTYFQINEVFADHESSRTPIQVPRSLLWNLPRRTVYFGTSIAAIFRGFIDTEPIQYCFSRGFVCVRGFDRKTREPKPLYARLHLPRSKAPNNKKPWARKVA
ncbi:hypothetical protein M5K25_016145 [Dendrobium thyrsiflorum]|uniref:HhH-GPD domain-containing protein n=1 Tax=Dendrobium thyrsiflorum TaxID=117978 RepID=A0ABD0UR19_DENTH